MIDMDALAQQQASKTGDAFEVWLSAIKTASKTLSVGELTDGEFEDFISESESPDAYSSVVRLFEEYKQANVDAGTDKISPFDLLAQHVDDSPFSFGEWLGAVYKMTEWMKVQRDDVYSPLPVVLGFLACCAQSLAGENCGLIEQVVAMLDEHGFDGKV